MTLLLPILRLVPVWAWALAAAIGWGAWQQHQARAAALDRAIATDRATKSEGARAREARTADAIQEIEHHARTRQITTRRAGAAAAVAGDGLRIRVAATAGAAASAAAAGRCDDAAASSAVLADVLGRLEPAGRAVASWADELDVALEACQQAYRAVTTP